MLRRIYQAEHVEDGASYLLLLVDPDAPTPDDPKFAFWRHWVVPGLRPAGHAAATQTKPALTEYLGPGPKDEYCLLTSALWKISLTRRTAQILTDISSYCSASPKVWTCRRRM